MPKDKNKDQEENQEEQQEEQTDERNETENLIETNVALLKAELKTAEQDLEKERELTAQLTKRLKQATDLIEDDTKAGLIADIAPRTDEPEKMLALKTVEELEHQKKILDRAKVPAFTSGTPLKSVDKSPRAKLNGMFDAFMTKHRKVQ